MNSSRLVDNQRLFWPFRYGVIGASSGSPTPARLPLNAIVDARIDVDGSIAVARHPRVYLAAVGYDPGPAEAVFQFRESGGAVCLFRIATSAWVSGLAVRTQSTGFDGFIVLGRKEEFLAIYNAVSAVDSPLTAELEPGAVRVDHHRIRRITVATQQRTLAGPPPGCGTSTPAREPLTVGGSGTTFRGVVEISPGFNARLTPTSGGLRLGVAKGAGLGEPCDDFRYAPGEMLQPNGTLDGALRCHETIRSISGVGGPHFRFSGGAGVDVIADGANNKVIIDVSFNGLDSCEE